MESVSGSYQQSEDDSSHLRQFNRCSTSLAWCCIDRPMHYLDGTVMGLCAAGSCMLFGAVSFVASPIECAVRGYEEAGIPGCIYGLNSGIDSGAVDCLICTAGGVYTGYKQILLGLWHTPETCIARTLGKEWHDRTQRWTYYSLQEEAALVLDMGLKTFVRQQKLQQTLLREFEDSFRTMAASCVGLIVLLTSFLRPCRHTEQLEARRYDPVLGGRAVTYYEMVAEHAAKDRTAGQSYRESLKVQGSTQVGSEGEQIRGSSQHVRETSLYDTLLLTPEASLLQITKAYVKLAQSSHPDKNPDDPTAEQRFQEIYHAYRTLSDEERRKKYNEEGGEAFSRNHQVDARQSYVQVFGHEKFKPFVGQMILATFMEAGDDHPRGARLQLAQWQREVARALYLVELLQPFVSQEIDETVFRQNIEDQASSLRDGVLGGALLQCIGQCYQHGASRALGNANVSGGIFERLRGMHTAFVDIWHQISTFALIEIDAIDSSMMRLSGDRSHMKKIDVRMSCEVDTKEIVDTLQVVCMKVTHDTTVDKAQRRRRAEALAIVGEIFCAQGCPLQTLDLSENALGSLPESFGHLSAPQRVELDRPTWLRGKAYLKSSLRRLATCMSCSC